MKDLEFFIASIKQFITGTANNLKTILDKKFKGVGLVEVTTETIRDSGDINIKLKNIPSENLIGNASGASATPTSFGIGDGLEFNAGKLRTEVGELSDIENSTTEQKSWSGEVLSDTFEKKITPVNEVSSITLSLNLIGTFNKYSGNITIPTNASVAFTIGTKIEGFAMNYLSVIASNGVVIWSYDNSKGINRYTAFALKKIGVNEWALIGNLT